MGKGAIGLGLCALVLTALAPSAVASGRQRRCHAGYVAKVVRVREHRHGQVVRRHGRVVWVRAWRCVRKPPARKGPAPPPTTPAAPAAPTVRYQAKVDPTLTQAAANPLAVTYGYSADATATNGATSTDLAAAGQLPAGVLNFYSAQQPGGPEELNCSMNVGGGTIGGSCPITYQSTGSYSVTTQYIPNGAAATTETDTETVSPYATSTTLDVVPISCDGLSGPSGAPAAASWQSVNCYRLSVSVSDQNGNVPPSGPFCTAGGCGQAVWLSSGSSSLAGSLPPGTTCSLEVYYAPSNNPQTAGTAGGYSPDCHTSTASVGWRSESYSSAELPTSWNLTASYQGQNSSGNGANGWTSSTSPTESVAS